MAARRSVPVRSYRDVVDVVERRIFRVDRWRLPLPGGLPGAAVGYALGGFIAVLALEQVPGVGQLLALLSPPLRYVGVPGLFAWALLSWQVDGRRPHHALVSVLRFGLSARTLAGLRRSPAVGTAFTPVGEVAIAPAGDDPEYRRGRVRGPATLILRYPAELELSRSVGRTASFEERLGATRRIRVRGLGDRRQRPLPVGRELRVGEGGEVRFS